MKRMKDDAQIQRVESDRTRKWQGAPSDPQYSNQWALPKISWDQVYGVANARFDTKVAILDTGVDVTHPDLTTAVVPGYSVLDATNGLTDENGHGTWLAGIVAAHTTICTSSLLIAAFDVPPCPFSTDCACAWVRPFAILTINLVVCGFCIAALAGCTPAITRKNANTAAYFCPIGLKDLIIDSRQR